MTEEKKHSILFILSDLNDNDKTLKKLLPDICHILVKKFHDVHFIYPDDIDEEFELLMRKVPWIHATKMNIKPGCAFSNLALPFAIRQYIKKHDGIDAIHSFGLAMGVLSMLGSLGCKTRHVNTPGIINDTTTSSPIEIFSGLIKDNISFIFNKVVGKIIIADKEQFEKSKSHVTYKNVEPVLLDTSKGVESLTESLANIYSDVIDNKQA